MIAPDEGGLTNYRSPSFDPKTGLFIVDAHPSYSLYFAKPADGNYGWAGADYGVWGKGVIEAIDYKTGQNSLEPPVGRRGDGAGVLTTDSGLTFTGDEYGNMLALETRPEEPCGTPARARRCRLRPSHTSWMGGNTLLTGSGSVLFAWALPQHSTEKSASIKKTAGH